MKTVIYRYPRRAKAKRIARQVASYAKMAATATGITLMTTGAAPPTSKKPNPAPKVKKVKKPARVIHPPHHYTTKERRVMLARTIWAEARGTGAEGMLAVAHVILNRVYADQPRFGSHIEGVVRKPWQFTCWRPNDPNYKPMINVEEYVARLPKGHADRIAWAQALQIARVVMSKDASDPTHGALFYYASSMDTPPKWAATMKHTATWNGHEFYRPWTARELKDMREQQEALAKIVKMREAHHRQQIIQAARKLHMTVVFEASKAKPKKHQPTKEDLKRLSKVAHQNGERLFVQVGNGRTREVK